MQKGPHKVREFRRREREILDTALKPFLKQGEGSVTVEMTADAVGIGEGMIYKRLKPKAEIYPRLMLGYERDPATLFHSKDVIHDREVPSRACFEFRMRDPQHYRLFGRLEERVVKTSQVSEMVEGLRKIRASNFEHLARLIREHIADGELESVPPHFHYCAIWALIHGVVALYHSPFWCKVLEDREDSFHFLADIGAHIGSKHKREDGVPST